MNATRAKHTKRSFAAKQFHSRVTPNEERRKQNIPGELIQLCSSCPRRCTATFLFFAHTNLSPVTPPPLRSCVSPYPESKLNITDGASTRTIADELVEHEYNAVR